MNTFDSLTLTAFVSENFEFLTGARIQKIQQPTRREVILFLRNNGILRKLYININPQFYHVCFMSEDNELKRGIEIPQKPPMFCMQLRKYIENAKIIRVNQPDSERILELFFETYDELKEKIELCLTIELMGKHSNIILYNADNNVILGCAHNVGPDKSSVREVMGGLPYIYPPKQDKKYIPKHQNDKEEPLKSINDIIDNCFAEKIYENNLKLIRSELVNYTQKQIKGLIKECELIKKSLETNKNYEDFKHIGDLIMANLYNLKDYTPQITVFDYKNNCERKITVNEQLTLKENAQNFYKKYTKIKKRTEKNEEILESYKQKLRYYEDILYFAENAVNINDLKEIKSELQASVKHKTEKEKTAVNELEINGFRVFIGKNNKQNDYIVSKLAKDDDYWFHVQNSTGSHVLLKCTDPDNKLIYECAKLAKEFSSAKNSSKAGVIYTKAKYLKKPPKSPLGYVTYKNEQEIVIG